MTEDQKSAQHPADGAGECGGSTSPAPHKRQHSDAEPLEAVGLESFTIPPAAMEIVAGRDHATVEDPADVVEDAGAVGAGEGEARRRAVESTAPRAPVHANQRRRKLVGFVLFCMLLSVALIVVAAFSRARRESSGWSAASSPPASSNAKPSATSSPEIEELRRAPAANRKSAEVVSPVRTASSLAPPGQAPPASAASRTDLVSTPTAGSVPRSNERRSSPAPSARGRRDFLYQNGYPDLGD